MKPLQERIEIEQHFANGGRVRSINLVDDCSNWVELAPECRESYIFNWRYRDYEKAPRTFTISGKEYPAALTEAPEAGTEVWWVTSDGLVCRGKWADGQHWLLNVLKNGALFATKEGAEASIEALAKLRRG